MSDEQEVPVPPKAPDAPEVFAVATVKPGNTPPPLDTTATGTNGGPCTVLDLYRWLSGHMLANPGVFTNDVVGTTASAIVIVPT